MFVRHAKQNYVLTTRSRSKDTTKAARYMCELPSNCNTFEEYTNLTEEMLQKCRASVTCQQQFNKKALVSALCGVVKSFGVVLMVHMLF